jgi:hypothetical protein
MNAILIIAGIVLILAAVLGRWVVPALAGTYPLMKVKGMIFCFVTAIILIAMTGAFFYAEPGYQYMVQYPWGKQTAAMKPGYNLRFWGNVLPFKKVITVRLTDEAEEESETATASDNAVIVRFNDTVRARVSLSARLILPTDSQKFVKLAREYRTESNLVQSTLVPVTREAVKNSARELSAQQYVSGGGSQFEINFVDQLNNGIVLLVTKSRTEVPPVEDIAQGNTQRTIKQRKVIIEEVKRVLQADGAAKRKTNPFIQYGITVAQATIEKVDPEKGFKNMLKQQRDAAARANIEKQKALEAEQAKRRVIAEGEKTKAEEKVKMEMEQVKKVTQAETAKKTEALKQEKAEIALKTAKLEAEAVRVRAKGEADGRRMKMVADGALEQKLHSWIKVNEVWAAALKNTRMVPDVVVGQSNNSRGGSPSATDFMNMMVAQSAKSLGADIQIKNK